MYLWTSFTYYHLRICHRCHNRRGRHCRRSLCTRRRRRRHCLCGWNKSWNVTCELQCSSQRFIYTDLDIVGSGVICYSYCTVFEKWLYRRWEVNCTQLVYTCWTVIVNVWEDFGIIVRFCYDFKDGWRQHRREKVENERMFVRSCENVEGYGHTVIREFTCRKGDGS